MKKTYNFYDEFRLEIIAFFVGLIILTFELTAARIVAPYLGSTVYTWTSIIGVILAALAVGYSVGGIIADKRKNRNDIVVLLVAAATTISLVNITKEQILRVISEVSMPLQLQSLIASLLLFAIPTIFLGAVIPYLVKLNIKDLASTGRKVAHIDAASTVGSLVGTFLTGYVLFGYIGTRNLLLLCSVVLILTSFIIKTKQYVWQRIFVLLALLIMSMLSPSPSLSGFVEDIDTAYNRVIVREFNLRGREVRVLQTDSLGLQSGIYTNNSDELAFEYTRALANVADLRPQAKRQLIIGGGAFTLPEYIAKKYPKTIVDAVEIDGDLVEISKKYFDLNQPSNLNIIQADGRQYLNQTSNKYDVITMDAFNSIIPPFQLLTRQAVQQSKRALSQDGIVTANIFSAAEGPRSSLMRAIYSTYKSEFKYVSIYRIAPRLQKNSQQNLLLIASDKAISKSQSVKIDLEFESILNAQVTAQFSGQKILTDDLAPVERYSL